MRAMAQSRRFVDRPTISGTPQLADILRAGRHVSKVPILLKKSFLGDKRNFSGPFMRFASGDVRGHIDSPKIDHGPS
jgi:hypothetical protein